MPPTKRRKPATQTSSSQSSGTVVEDDYEVEKVLDKKVHKSKTWYKIKWVGWVEPTWELAKDCKCEALIKEYEQMIEEQSKDEDEDEWEVEEIVDKRITKSDGVEYLLKWKNWQGEPTWVKEKDCECVNLIAAYENPKLKKMWNFSGSNPRLWLDQTTMLNYMAKYAQSNNYDVNILEFLPDFPTDEKPQGLYDGVNIGPLSYKNHWYLIIIIVNYINTTRELLICDPLNTLIGVSNRSTRVDPVFKRMTKLYPNVTPEPVAMTPMNKSDMCAFYVLAAFERALFLLSKHAKFIVNKLFFDKKHPELIRSRIAPQTDHEISVNLLTNENFLGGPVCEFCGFEGSNLKIINLHIIEEHFTRPQDLPPPPSRNIFKNYDLSNHNKKRSNSSPKQTATKRRTKFKQ